MSRLQTPITSLAKDQAISLPTKPGNHLAAGYYESKYGGELHELHFLDRVQGGLATAFGLASSLLDPIEQMDERREKFAGYIERINQEETILRANDTAPSESTVALISESARTLVAQQLSLQGRVLSALQELGGPFEHTTARLLAMATQAEQSVDFQLAHMTSFHGLAVEKHVTSHTAVQEAEKSVMGITQALGTQMDAMRLEVRQAIFRQIAGVFKDALAGDTPVANLPDLIKAVDTIGELTGQMIFSEEQTKGRPHLSELSLTRQAVGNTLQILETSSEMTLERPPAGLSVALKLKLIECQKVVAERMAELGVIAEGLKDSSDDVKVAALNAIGGLAKALANYNSPETVLRHPYGKKAHRVLDAAVNGIIQLVQVNEFGVLSDPSPKHRLRAAIKSVFTPLGDERVKGISSLMTD